jgi:hypothetical protein
MPVVHVNLLLACRFLCISESELSFEVLHRRYLEAREVSLKSACRARGNFKERKSWKSFSYNVEVILGSHLCLHMQKRPYAVQEARYSISNETTRPHSSRSPSFSTTPLPQIQHPQSGTFTHLFQKYCRTVYSVFIYIYVPLHRLPNLSRSLLLQPAPRNNLLHIRRQLTLRDNLLFLTSLATLHPGLLVNIFSPTGLPC